MARGKSVKGGVGAGDENLSLLIDNALFSYCLSFVPKLRGLPEDEILMIAKECSDIALENPLYYINEPKFELSFLAGRKFTGLQVMALMISCLWVLCGEREDVAGGLVHRYPWLKDVSKLLSDDGGEGR